MSELLDIAGMVSVSILLVLLQEHVLGQKACPALAPSWSLSEGAAPPGRRPSRARPCALASLTSEGPTRARRPLRADCRPSATSAHLVGRSARRGGRATSAGKMSAQLPLEAGRSARTGGAQG